MSFDFALPRYLNGHPPGCIGTSVLGKQRSIFTFQLSSIDLPDDVPHTSWPSAGKTHPAKSRVFLHQGDGVETALKLFNSIPNCRPLFFLDGDHAYASVKRELSCILDAIADPKILLHDTLWQEPSARYNVDPADAIAAVPRDGATARRPEPPGRSAEPLYRVPRHLRLGQPPTAGDYLLLATLIFGLVPHRLQFTTDHHDYDTLVDNGSGPDSY